MKRDPRKNNRSMLVWPRFPFVRLLWVYKCVRVFSYITFSCQLLECLKFDKAQVLLKTEWLSKKRERQFNFLASSFSLSCSLVCLTFSCLNNFSTVPLFYTHTHAHTHAQMGRNWLMQVHIMQFKFFPVGKISQSCIIVLKTQLKRHTHDFLAW